jgi:putative ABC transport system permease protein
MSAPNWRRYLRFWGPNVAGDVDDELNFHIEMLARHLEASGIPRPEAERIALERFGDLRQVGETLRAHDYRQVRHRQRKELMGNLARDARMALRGLRRAPGFAAVAIVTLALGIGANTAIFSVVDAVLLRPLPFVAPHELVSVWGSTQGELLRIGDLSRSYQALGAHRPESMSISGEGEPERLDGASATAGLFETLGVPPALGRTFVPAENEQSADRVVVLSDALWRRRYGADPAIIGRTVNINGFPHAVIGVMPAGFHYPARSTLAWIPMMFERANSGQIWGWGGNRITARLAPGVSAEAAQAELRQIARRIRTDNPVWDPGEDYGRDATVIPLQEQAVGSVRPTLLLLLGVVGAVLLIACANVANLLLVRGAAREKELAIRSALGGGRARLLRQLLTESVLLSTLGALAGLVLAWFGLRVLIAMLPPDMPRISEIGIDLRVLAFTGGMAVLTGLAFGLVPALRSAGSNLLGSLNESGRSASRGPRHQRLSNGLVVAEIALSVVLVASAGLLVRSFIELNRVDPGFTSTRLVVARVSAPEQGYAEPERRRALFDRLLERVAAYPGVESVAAVNPLPLRDPLNGMAIRVQGQFEDMRRTLPSADHYQMITPGYLNTMGIPLISGRAFTADDRQGAPDVVLVSESIAEKFWPGQDAVGERIGYPWPSPWLTIVGVVRDVKTDSLSSTRTMAVYRPFAQAPIPAMTVVARTGAPPGLIGDLLRATVAEIDPGVPISDVAAMDYVVASSMARPRFAMALLAAFAAVALLLGAVGIYGVIAYTVSQRTREIGVRMALGATASDTLWMVIRRGVLLTAAGVALGTIAALGTTRLLAGLLYGVSPTDPATFGAVAVISALVAIAACYVPARRATLVDPTVALRGE